jgi:lysine-N-methylase
MNKIEYHLAARNSFACIGNECPATCCFNWKIVIDPEAYQQWQTLADEDERARLLGAVSKSVENNQDVLLMKKDASGYCCMLTSDSLCSIQQRDGEAMMPAVCRTYPRVNRTSSLYAFNSLSLSCPEAARHVLLSVSEPVFRKVSPRQLNILTDDDQIRYALTELFDRVMAEPKYRLATRVFFFADFIVQLARHAMQNQLSLAVLNKAIANSKNELYQLGVRIKERRLRAIPAVAGSFWYSLVRIGRGKGLLSELDAASPLLIELSDDPSSRTEQYAAIHTEVQRLRDTTLAACSAYDANFSRYLHASLMYHGFPWNPVVNNYVVSFMRAIVPFSLARLGLWLRAEQQGGLQEQDVVQITYQTERSISHSDQVISILERNPRLLEMDQYYHAFLDL